MNKLILLGMVFLLFFGCTQEQTDNNIQNNTGTQGFENQGTETVAFVEVGDYIEVEYLGTFDDDTIFDTNIGGDPLGFTAGAGQVIKGFDDSVIGMKIGEEKHIHLEPEEAYGLYDPEMVADFPLENVPEGVQVGDTLVAENGAYGTVVDITNETTTVDFNHPLAGFPLNFRITVLSITKN